MGLVCLFQFDTPLALGFQGLGNDAFWQPHGVQREG